MESNVIQDFHDDELSSLEIKIKGPVNNLFMNVLFFSNSAGVEKAGGFLVWFTNPPKYGLIDCTQSLTIFDLPDLTGFTGEMIWNIAVTRSPETRVVVYSRDMAVIDVTLSDTTCGKSDWRTVWTQEITKIQFSNQDTVSKFYKFNGHGKLF